MVKRLAEQARQRRAAAAEAAADLWGDGELDAADLEERCAARRASRSTRREAQAQKALDTEHATRRAVRRLRRVQRLAREAAIRAQTMAEMEEEAITLDELAAQADSE